MLVEDPVLARRALDGFNTDLTTLASDVEGRRAFFDSKLALTEKRWDAAIALIHRALAAFQENPKHGAAQLGWAHDQAGRADSAVVYYEKFLDTPAPDPDADAVWLARVLRRLGELHESRGEMDQAIANYARFVNLWKNAEPEQQPLAREITQRLERLRSKRG
jgi:tetratricopeptide (TPR) repeat protein